MQSQNVSTLRNRSQRDTDGTQGMLIDRSSQDFCEEAFARVPDQDWSAQAAQPGDASKQFEVMLGCFSKPDSGIEYAG